MQPDTHAADSISFLCFRLDRRAGSLTRGNEAIPLRPKTWSVLLYLAERPGRLVTRDELLDAVWPNVAVTPSTLTKSIVELREALRDDARAPRCIETVHRRGFRFIAKVTETASNEASPSGWGVRAADPQVFVGREAERRRLIELFLEACSGKRQTVFIAGPTGVGKTSLLDTFLDSLPATGCPVWIARGSGVEQRGTRESYMPVLDALEGLARRPDGARLIALLRRAAPTWLVQIPWLLEDEVDAIHSREVARPERMLRELAALTEALTTEVMLVLGLEDLHWSDPSTIDLLGFLAQRREPARLLVIGTYRPPETAAQDHPLRSTLHTLKARRQCTELALRNLSEEELRHYLDLRFPGAGFAPMLAAKIHEYTDGNPLFMTSVVQHELLRGRIVETNPGWALSVPLERLRLEIPEDLREMIGAELESLRPADRALLQAASVVGIEFSTQVVATALECGLADAESHCEGLARANWFLRSAGTAERPDGSVVQCYAFTHELYRSVAYAEIPEARRQRLHQRVGSALENAFGIRASEIASQLAAHFEQGHDHERAVTYLATAASRARQRFAVSEAADRLQSALALAKLLPNEDARCQRELELRLALGSALNELHGFASAEVGENYERAHDLSVRAGSCEQQFQIVYALAHFYAGRANRELIDKALIELDQLAQRLGTTEHRVLADSALVRAANVSGRFAEACRLAEERLPAARWEPASESPPILGADPVVLAHCHHAFSLWMLGQCERARAIMRVTRRSSEANGEPFGLVSVLWFSAVLEVLGRSSATARELVERAIDLSDEHRFAYWNSMSRYLLGGVMVQEGRIGAAIDELDRAKTSLAAMGARLFSTQILCFLAEAHLLGDSSSAGLNAVEEGLSTAESTLDRAFLPELWRLKGELLLQIDERTSAVNRSRMASRRSAGNGKEVECCFQRAIDSARRAKAKSLELRAVISLARLWQARKQTADAHRLLAEICQWFDKGDGTIDLGEARALLDQLRETMMPGQLSGRRRIGR